ncbi:hypothetical protein HYFRA_00011623 [Hymenoscyphus fraxineus]|uniref:Heterokaryon incompatibility domain-containing protein n=1 Tax=Hymenoscyphus fraxineus TaxID=746836 RepID=A0A9N9KZ79_9HELO|nr:hypothetical protein HYFRA_00011623 [Hymenoscyphus fraxineus]
MRPFRDFLRRKSKYPKRAESSKNGQSSSAGALHKQQNPGFSPPVSSDEDQNIRAVKLNSDTRAKSVDPSWIDIEMIASWLQNCDEYHGLECCKPLGLDPSNLPRPALLIDIRRKCLTKADSSHRYACLSYVWGGASNLQATRENLASLLEEKALETRHNEIPKTIKHTMGLMEQLGIHYLWVDALCIVQDDAELKHVQIRAMGGIYANAYVTVIAGNGWDANHGIRGIQGVTEPRQLSTFSKMDFEENFQPHSSIWYSRGWTFQECLLSPRKIMFQYQGVIWECNEASWHEGSLPQDQAPSSFEKEITISPWGNRYKITSSPDIDQYVELAYNYTSRKLSYAQDALPAITGLLSLMSASFPGSFISGLPEMFLDEALLWQPKESMQRRQATTFEDSPPSWSWVGWEGGIMREEWLEHFAIEYYGHEETARVTPLFQWQYDNKSILESRVPVSRQGLVYPLYTKEMKPSGPHQHNTNYSSPSSANDELNHPKPIRYLYCRTERGLFKKLCFYERRIKGHGSSTLIALQDAQGNCVGSLNIYLEDPQIVKNLEVFELVTISLGKAGNFYSHSLRRQGLEWRSCLEFALAWGNFGPASYIPVDFDGTVKEHRSEFVDFKEVEFYYVLWIGWEGKVAYRRGLGRVSKEAWDSQATDEIDLVLG